MAAAILMQTQIYSKYVYDWKETSLQQPKIFERLQNLAFGIPEGREQGSQAGVGRGDAPGLPLKQDFLLLGTPPRYHQGRIYCPHSQNLGVHNPAGAPRSPRVRKARVIPYIAAAAAARGRPAEHRPGQEALCFPGTPAPINTPELRGPRAAAPWARRAPSPTRPTRDRERHPSSIIRPQRSAHPAQVTTSPKELARRTHAARPAGTRARDLSVVLPDPRHRAAGPRTRAPRGCSKWLPGPAQPSTAPHARTSRSPEPRRPPCGPIPGPRARGEQLSRGRPTRRAAPAPAHTRARPPRSRCPAPPAASLFPAAACAPSQDRARTPSAGRRRGAARVEKSAERSNSRSTRERKVAWRGEEPAADGMRHG
ncbi:serine/arginine repetitive matrix protein 1-like [Nannospalax galili]|uniref:serine/arginine repetitive matrix protein 1-like n=1 Tax=Nannospalax galili TaxID=1026970 RepID=UPI00111BFA92|nr:serine/arginine repetitive matrix protein 1-like [Nannospalax galili]